MPHRPHMALIVAGRAFDLNHLGADVGQHGGAERPGKHTGEIEDADPLQRAVDRLCHHTLLYTRTSISPGNSKKIRMRIRSTATKGVMPR